MNQIEGFRTTPLIGVFDATERDICFSKEEQEQENNNYYQRFAGTFSLNSQRFLIWKAEGPQLLLVERSLSTNLADCSVNLKLPGSILPRVCIQFLPGKQQLAITFATTASTIHRILLPTDMLASNADNRSILSGLNPSSTSNSSFANILRGHQIVSLELIDKNCSTLIAITSSSNAFIITLPSIIVPQITPNNQQILIQKLNVLSMLSSVLSTFSKTAGDSSRFINANSCQNVFVTAHKDSILRFWSLDSKTIIHSLPLQFPDMNLSTQRIRMIPCEDGGFKMIVVASSETRQRSLLWLLEGNFSGVIGDNFVRIIDDIPVNLVENQEIIDVDLFNDTVFMLGKFNNETFLKYAHFGPNSRFQEVSLEKSQFIPEEFEEPDADLSKLAYDYISYPGRISNWAIIHSLNQILEIINTDNKLNPITDVQLALKMIPEAVKAHASLIHQQNEGKGDIIVENRQAWKHFIETCNELAIEDNEAFGIGILQSMNTICIIRSGYISVMRECNKIELISLQNKYQQEIQPMISCSLNLSELCGAPFSIALERAMMNPDQESIIQAANSVVSELYTSCNSESITKLLSSVKDPKHQIEILMHIIENSISTEEKFETGTQANSNSNSKLLCSISGSSLVYATALQLCEERFKIIKNLFIFGTALTHIQSKVKTINDQTSSEIRTHILNRLQTIMSVVWLDLWAFKLRPQIANDLDSKISQVFKTFHISSFSSPLQPIPCNNLLINFYPLIAPSNRNANSDFKIKSLLGISMELLRSLNFSDAQKCSVPFCSFLLETGQYNSVKEFVHLVNSNGSQSSSSLYHIKGIAHLKSNEPYRAVDCFCIASSGVNDSENETSLFDWSSAKSITPTQTIGHLDHYFLRCIEMLEHQKEHDQVIRLAEFALSALDSNNQQTIANLWTSIFNNALEILNFEKAYTAALSNPNRSIAEANIRLFTTTVLTKGATKELSRPFPGFYQVVADSLKQQARLQDVALPLGITSFYDVLYIFFTSKKNFRGAAQAMLEYGDRLSKESYRASIELLEKEKRAYLSALNSLRLVSPKSQWLHFDEFPSDRPKSKQHNQTPNGLMPSPSKRPKQEAITDPDIEAEILTDGITTIHDLEKLCALANARVKYAKHIMSKCGTTNEVIALTFEQETVQLLAKENLWFTSASLAKMHGLDPRPAFESLTNCCAMSTKGLNSNVAYSDAEWDEGNGDCWKTLQLLLEQYGNDEHFCLVADMLLGYLPNSSLPQWISSHLESHYPERFMNILIKHNQVEQATNLLSSLVSNQSQEQQQLQPIPHNTLDSLGSALVNLPDSDPNVRTYRQILEHFGIYSS